MVTERFDKFTEDNDPHGEHGFDLPVFEYLGLNDALYL